MLKEREVDDPPEGNAPAECAVSVKIAEGTTVSSTLAIGMSKPSLSRIPTARCHVAGDASPSPMLAQFTAALGVSGDVLADDDPLEHAWSQLPNLLK